MKRTKILICAALLMFISQAFCQITEPVVVLTGSQDQIRFQANGENRYFLMSKTISNNNRALSLYSPDDGGWFFSVKENSGDFILEKGNLGIGEYNPTAKLHLNGNMKVPFVWNMTESTYNREVLSTGWLSGVGDFMSIKHGGNNTEAGTYGLRLSDGRGLEYGQDNYGSVQFRITTQGNVGIGTSNPDERLTVDGTIHAEEVRVDLNIPGPDYVFEEDYDLMSLESIQQYIKENKHLPEVPSASEMEEKGIEVSDMSMLLLKKIEELTLHMIQIKEENKQYREAIQSLKDELTILKNQ